MFAALAFVAVLAPRGDDPRANRDLAGLIVTTLLGTVYFLYMQFLIDWYGNIPDKVKWYAARTAGRWPIVALLAFSLGAAIPFLAILNQEVRRNPALLRWVGGLILIGLALHIAWMTIPPAGLAVIVPAIVTAFVLTIFLLSTRHILPGIERHA
jgi:O-antigen/teichoic acid export membrane protein